MSQGEFYLNGGNTMESTRSTIFLVDDDMTNLTVGKEALKKEYNVFTLASGHLLFNMLENKIPDLILLDVNMPEMNGYEVIKILKENRKTTDIPVVFLTSMSHDYTELEGLSLGAVDYIRKPFSAPLLRKRISVHLLVESQRKELLSYNSKLKKEVKEQTRNVTELKNAVLSTMAELVEFRDGVTGGHITRTQRYMDILFEKMLEFGIYEKELSEMDKDSVVTSCQLHDVGKIAIQDSILTKEQGLTPEEFTIIKKHTTFGEEVILRLKGKTRDSEFLENARIFAISHHEKWDGTGYPFGLKGYDIPLLGRMMAIADVYDALIAKRTYKSAFSHEKAIEIMLSGRGTQFDPVLIDLFEKIHEEFAKIAVDIEHET